MVPRHLYTVPQFAERHPAFPVTSLRWLRFNQDRNGFSEAFLKVEGRVLVDEDVFFAVLDRSAGATGTENK